MLFLADVATGPLLVGFGLAGFLVSAGVVLLEAGALWLLRWAPFPRCLSHSVVINLVSALPGVVLAFLFAEASEELLHLDPPATGLAALAFAGLVTVTLEAPLLHLLSREPWMKCWRVAALVNGASYLALFGVLNLLEPYF